MLKQDERGFTLVELLVAIAITSLLSVAVARAIDTTQTALTRSADRAITSTQALRFADALRYDLSGAADVILFSDAPPANTSQVCSSWSATNGSEWATVDAANFVRPLFTVLIPTITPPSWPVTNSAYLPSNTQKVGYELRRDGAAYVLVRVDCATGGRKLRQLSLGSPLPMDVTGLTVLHCINANGVQVQPTPASSTMTTAIAAAQRCASFAFVLPDNATPLQRELLDQRLQHLRSEVSTA